MADRIGVIDHGELMLVEDKATLMQRLGKTTATLVLAAPLERLPASLAGIDAELSADGRQVTLVSHGGEGEISLATLIRQLDAAGAEVRTVETRRSTLEDIFVELVGEGR